MYEIPRVSQLNPDRLELVDQLYFLFLDEYKGNLVVSRHTASLGLITAVLIDLADNDYLDAEVHSGVIRTRRPRQGPPASALAHTVWETISYQHELLPVETWLQYWVTCDFFTMVSERMVYRGLLRRIDRRRLLKGETVEYDPAQPVLAQGPLRHLQRTLTDARQAQLTEIDLRVIALLAALDLTGRLGIALGEAHRNALHRRLPQGHSFLLDKLRTCAGATAMTSRT